ncbi:MAG: hypothetical protein ACI4IS_02750 [Acutalibacteraceae bacterium]
MIRLKISRELLSDFLCVAVCVLLFGIAVIFSQECESGAFKGVEYCLKILVPSLFPFMVLSSFLVNSRALQIIRQKTGFISKLFQSVSPDIVPVLVLCLTGGYPVGARCISSLFQSGAISEKQAQKMSLYAVGAGPGFLITYVGTQLCTNKQIGFILLVCQVISVLILAVFCEILFKETKEKEINVNNKKPVTGNTMSYALVKSVSQGVSSIVNMCAMVVFFSSFLEILRFLLADFEWADKYISILFEVTAACGLLCKNGELILLAFAVGFGGICVHFQIFAILRDIKINKAIFFVMRLAQGIICALTAKIIFHFFPVSVEVFRTVENVRAVSFGTIWGGIAFILCSCCFLFSIKSSH